MVSQQAALVAPIKDRYHRLVAHYAPLEQRQA
jgi:hypothetical protein